MEHVLLVRGFKGASCWGFPRGKIMKDESDADCAVREVSFGWGGVGVSDRASEPMRVCAQQPQAKPAAAS
jgi:hypothetical protein